MVPCRFREESETLQRHLWSPRCWLQPWPPCMLGNSLLETNKTALQGLAKWFLRFRMWEGSALLLRHPYMGFWTLLQGSHWAMRFKLQHMGSRCCRQVSPWRNMRSGRFVNIPWLFWKPWSRERWPSRCNQCQWLYTQMELLKEQMQLVGPLS